MKKVGIMTFHFADNFGAVLQAYALSKKIDSLGLKAEIIDFIPKQLREDYDLFLDFETLKRKGIVPSLKKIAKDSLIYKKKIERIQNFKVFRSEHLNLSKTKFIDPSELQNSEKHYDYYITGSDQVWNPDFFKRSGGGGVYFLNFADGKSKKISYAASIATSNIPEKYIPLFKENLKRFDSISVREDSASILVSEYTNKKINVTLDPIFLLNQDEWKNISEKDTPSEDYILVYDLIKDPVTVGIANEIAKKNGYKIVSYSDHKGFINWHSSFFSSNPTKLLGLINDAKLIVTSSFHGTAFAINFNKPFYTVPHPTRGSRMIDLVSSLNLNERIVRSVNEAKEIEESIDYKSVNKKIDVLKNKAENFLKGALDAEN